MEAGTHYIRLYSTYDGESTDLYHLTIAYDTADNFEINNQYSSATLINPGQTVRANINAAGDVDLYSFTAINNHPAQVWVPAVPEGLPYMSVEIFSSASGSSTIYHKYLYPGNALSEMTSVNLNPGQKYYVRISSSAAGASVKQYQLKIDNQ
jgi:hypothetical protein